VFFSVFYIHTVHGILDFLEKKIFPVDVCWLEFWVLEVMRSDLFVSLHFLTLGVF
jgi:hypothetical protein